jgi:hypothetical protein
MQNSIELNVFRSGSKISTGRLPALKLSITVMRSAAGM